MKQTIILLVFAVTFLFVGCKKSDDPTSSTHTDCATQLEVAINCKAVLPDCDGEQLKNSVRCLGKNVNQARCNNNTKNPCEYCYLHTSQWNGACPNQTKNACGYCDEHKEQYKP